jgi:hypothetical protein
MTERAKTWKGLKKFEVEARRIIVRHAESFAKKARFEEEVTIVDGFPRIRLKCLLFPWLLQCRHGHRMFPWLCWYCWVCPLPCKYCPDPPPYGVDPIVAIDAILQHLPDLEPTKITEDAVLKAAIAVMEKKMSLVRQSVDRVSELLKKF